MTRPDKISAVLALAGIALFLWGVTIDPYIDADAARRLIVDACDEASQVRPGWADRLAAQETMRWPLMNSGLSFAMISGSIAVLARWDIVRRGHLLATPSKRAHFFVLGIAALTCCAFGIFSGISLDLSRNKLPWCADSIGIPIGGLIAILPFIFGICGVVGLLLVRWFGKLPIEIMIWDAERPMRSWGITLCLAPIALLLILVAFSSAFSSGFLAVPGYLALIYITASTRAALLSPIATKLDG